VNDAVAGRLDKWSVIHSFQPEVPSLGSLVRRFFEAGSFRISRIMCGIGLAPLLPELWPQVCYPIRCKLASVTPSEDPRAFVGLG